MVSKALHIIKEDGASHGLFFNVDKLRLNSSGIG